MTNFLSKCMLAGKSSAGSSCGRANPRSGRKDKLVCPQSVSICYKIQVGKFKNDDP